ncbi:MAG: type VI secretion system baseplate subunit TssF [Holosporales bacterium]|jgi:type VI secretion system protein ImpG|nr:type VI secretion system baseplate subunit TssF [Holosporales bacterium]
MKKSETLDYYLREMDYLKNAGADFAQKFPQAASRLDFDAGETSTDPHVSRLIESFAFLTAKLQHRVDNVASGLTDALIDVLYPHLNRPLPAMSIARFNVNEGGNKPAKTGFTIHKGTSLSARASGDGGTCRFTTVYPLKLLPIKVIDVSIVQNSAYHFAKVPNTIDFGYRKYSKLPLYFCEVTFECFNGFFSELALDELLIHLNMEDKKMKMQFYKALTCGDFLVYCVCSEDTAIPMPPRSLLRSGFTREEMAIPPANDESHAYQLLQEYMHFREKFMFFRITQLDFLKYLSDDTFLQTNQLKLLLPLHNINIDLAEKIAADHLRVSDTPIINLYSTITDPISIDNRRTFYQVMPDAYKDRTSEVYRIDQAFAIEAKTGEVHEIAQYFSLREQASLLVDDDNEGNNERGGSGAEAAAVDQPSTHKKSMFWWSHCVPTHHENVTGFDTEISFVDLDFNVLSSPEYTVYTKSLCTNRFLAEDVPRNAVLQLDRSAPINNVTCAQKPVAPLYCLEKGRNNARLISQLAVNYLGFPYKYDSNIKDYVWKVLTTHADLTLKTKLDNMFSEIKSICVSHTTRRVGYEVWRGVVDGVQLDIDIMRSSFIDECFLLAHVLQQFFAMNCQINTFIALALRLNETKIFELEGIYGEQLFI